MNLIKKNKKLFLGILIGTLLSSITVYAANKYLASDVQYKNTTVEKALNDLYSMGSISCNEKFIGASWNFDYANKGQIFNVPCSGKYKIELWGAQGYSGNWSAGGKGAYVTGNIKLNANKSIMIFVGGSGNNKGYNGGGSGTFYGGGATDVRVDYNNDNDFSLIERIMVASGGSGAYNFSSSWYRTGTDGGTINGKNGSVTTGTIPTGGTQTSGGKGNSTSLEGKFGFGGNNTNSNVASSGGGGGYYGGGATTNIGYSTEVGGSGSSFISGYENCDAMDKDGKHTGQPNHYSGLIFTDSNMISGSDTMPTYDGTTTKNGNVGNGYAKITLISLK